MQTVIKIFLCFTVVSFNAHSEDKKVKLPSSAKLLSAMSVNKHSTEKTDIFNIKDELICVTEINPFFVISKNISEKDLMTEVENYKLESIRAGKSNNCERHESISLFLKNKSHALCSNNIAAKKLTTYLSKICGRSY